MIWKVCFFGQKKMRFMQTESVLQTKNRSSLTGKKSVFCSPARYAHCIWAGAQQNKQNDLCIHQTFSSAWASTQSDQSLPLCLKKIWILNYPRPNYCGHHLGKINSHKSTYAKVWQCTFWWITMFLTEKPWVKLFECQAEVFGWLNQAYTFWQWPIQSCNRPHNLS